MIKHNWILYFHHFSNYLLDPRHIFKENLNTNEDANNQINKEENNSNFLLFSWHFKSGLSSLPSGHCGMPSHTL